MTFILRDASSHDLDRLSALILRAKAGHGYDAAFMEACRHELQMTERRLELERVRVAEREGEPIGVSALALDRAPAELVSLFVEPVEAKRGVGLALWRDAIAAAARAGATALRIDSDPHAVDWYLARGGVRRGEVPSGSIPGRFIPWLEFAIAPT